MHIDLNSCFATCEQQARPMLRGKPVAISNRASPNSAIITASYEAKSEGVKVGMRRLEALKICPNLVFIEAEPSKYRYVYHRLMNIMKDYSPGVTMKSIDEGVIDFTHSTRMLGGRSLEDIGHEIKQRLFHLCEDVGARLRSKNRVARGLFIYAKTHTHGYWHRRHKFQWSFFTDKTIWALAQQMFKAAPGDIREIGVTCYDVETPENRQLSLFCDELAREERVQSAVDEVNLRFGARTIHFAETLPTRQVKVKIPFGSTRYL